MRLAWFAAAAVLVALLAGCASPQPSSSSSAPPPSPPASLPPGCDANRTAVAHHAPGVLLPGAAGLPHPCLSETGAVSFEPTIGITKTGTVFTGISVPDFSTTTPTSVSRSTNQGKSWDEVQPNLMGKPTHPTTEDFYMYIDPVTSRLFVSDLTGINCSTFSWTDDEGATWTTSLAGCIQFDHQTIFAGPPVASTTVGYPDVVYYCSANLVALAGFSTTSSCEKSLDGGLTFAPTGEPAFTVDPPMPGYLGVPGDCTGLHGHGFVDFRGWVYLPKGHCGQPWLAISKDEGLTWTRVQVSDLGMPFDGSIWDHEAGVAVDPAGNIYYGWVAGDRLPYLTVSRDNGTTWSKAVMVGAPGLKESSIGELIVGGVGKLAMAYMGSMNSPGTPWTGNYHNATWNGYLMMSADALDANATFYTASINDPGDPLVRGTCGVIRCQEVLDFLDVRIAPDGTPWASYVDACQKSCVGDEAGTDDAQAGIVGRLWGGASLWDAGDPNGPYPNPAP
jgi:hypothetical protein